MSVRNSFAFLDDSDDDEPRQQVKTKAKTKAKAKAPAAAPPARNNNRGPRRDGDYNRGRNNRSGGRGEYNRDVGENARKYRRDDRRTDRRRDAERRDRRREGGGNNRDRRGRNQYEKAHQKRGPKKGGHGGWGTDKDAVAVAEETAAGAAEASPEGDGAEEAGDDETPAEPAAPAVVELTLEEHEAAEKERRAKFNERWGSNSSYDDASMDLEKEFSGMSVVSKKNRPKETETWAAKRSTAKAASRSYQKERELKAAIFAEPSHGGYGGGGEGYGGGRGGSGRGRGGRGRNNRSDTRDNRGTRRSNVNTQDVNEFPALA